MTLYLSRKGVDRPGDSPDRSAHRFGRAGTVLLVLLPGLAIGVLGRAFWWAGDDGMIYSRVVRQILAGNGPVYNAWERAEPATGTLWEWLSALVVLVTRAEPAHAAAWLGIGCTALGYTLLTDATRRYMRSWSGAPLLPLGLLVLLSVKSDWDYATSGLETGLATLWLAGCWWLLVRGRADLPTALIFGLGPLVRPDLGLATAVFAFGGWLSTRPSLRRSLGLLATGLALPAGYEVFRAGYYGVLVPLPGLTKEAGASGWARGWAYLLNFVAPYWLLVPLALLVLAATLRPPRLTRRQLVLGATPVAAGLLQLGYVVEVGGDFMHGRMFVPVLLLLMAPVAVVPLSRRTAALVAATGLWAVCCATMLRAPADSGDGYRIVDEQRAYAFTLDWPQLTTRYPGTASHSRFERDIAPFRRLDWPVLILNTGGDGFVVLPLSTESGARLAEAWGALGANGRDVPLADGVSVDSLSLAYPLGAHQQRRQEDHPVRAGHEKWVDLPWIVADYAAPGAALPKSVSPRQVAEARAALHCGPLAELQRSVRAPLTVSRFWSNLTGAWSRTRFRYPASPARAAAQLCRK